MSQKGSASALFVLVLLVALFALVSTDGFKRFYREHMKSSSEEHVTTGGSLAQKFLGISPIDTVAEGRGRYQNAAAAEKPSSRNVHAAAKPAEKQQLRKGSNASDSLSHHDRAELDDLLQKVAH